MPMTLIQAMYPDPIILCARKQEALSAEFGHLPSVVKKSYKLKDKSKPKLLRYKNS